LLLVCLAIVGLAACGGDGGGEPARGAGALDHSFRTRGEVSTDFGHYAVLWALDETRDGRIVALGSTLAPHFVERFGLVRYRADGRVDETFGTKGLVETGVALETFPVAVDARNDGTTIV